MEGGAGDDTYIIGLAGVTVTEAAGGGDDTVQTNLAAYTLGTNLERLTFTGTVAFSGTGNAEANVITGGVGADTLSGAGGDDQLIGGDGADILIGGAGADGLIGGAGTDTVRYATAVTVNLATGAHTGDAAGDTYDGVEIIQGSTDADTFVSGLGADRLDGNSGIDTISYAGSSDGVSINLTTGAASGGYAAGDILSGFEKVVGSEWGDTLASSTSAHVLAGGAGDDIYVVGNSGVVVQEDVEGGNDTIQTALATYVLTIANVENVTYTGSSAFTGTGNTGANTITGGGGADTLDGGAGDDILIGGDGADILIGGAGADALVGGAGTDTIRYGSAVVLNLYNGEGAAGDAVGDTFDGIEVFQGSTAADTFISGLDADRLDGAAGVDTISYAYSWDGVNVNLTTNVVSGGFAQGDVIVNFERVVGSGNADTLASSTSTHTLAGGGGDDVYIVGAAGVTLSEDVDAGDDTVQTSLASYTLTAANIENLSYTGSATFTGTGNAGANVLNGGAGADTLDGGGGDDTLYGNDGADILIGGAGADHFYGGAGSDTVRYASAVTINLSTGVHTGDAAGDTFDGIELIQGSSSADLFVASELADRLDGADGTDTLSYAGSILGVNVNITTNVVSGGSAEGDVIGNFESVTGSDHEDVLGSSTSAHVLAGGKGDDIYVVGAAGVIVQEAVGEGVDTIQTALSSFTLASANVENLTYVGTGNFTGTGAGGDDKITGGVGGDTLTGGGGDDTLIGGDGGDTLNGGAGWDVLAGGGGNDILIGGDGVDDLDGGAGYDIARYVNAVTVNTATGASTGDAAGDIYTDIELIQGSSFADTFIAGYGADAFDGAGGSDLLSYAHSGDGVSVNLTTNAVSGAAAEGDVISNFEKVIGSEFNDTLGSLTSGHTLTGGLGDDTYVVGSFGVIVQEAADGGSDTIRTSLATFTLSVANVENLTYSGAAAFAGTGSAGDNIITGGVGNDTLDGAAGNDTLDGGDGDDVLIGGTDTLSYAASSGAVNVNPTTNVVSGGDAAGDVVSNFERVVGSQWDDVLASSTNGHVLAGGLGDDTYLAGATGVVIQEAAGEGNDTLQTALASFTLTTANIENLAFVGTGAFTGVGSADDNTISGGAGGDTLSGAAAPIL